MGQCEVQWCDQAVCEPSDLCRMHTLELPSGDARLGPTLQYFPISLSPGEFPRRLGKLFWLTTNKDGVDQVSEVPENFYAPDVPVQVRGQTEVAPEAQKCMQF